MNNLAIIPARGGSKRIPRKNIKDFLGEPMISYSIRAAKNSGLFRTIMVSTDDEEIAETAKRQGAEIPFFRSPENSDDHATTADVLVEVLEWYSQQQIVPYENVSCIYPCAPLIQSEKLIQAYELLLTGYDSVIPIVPFGYPLSRALETRNGKVRFSVQEHWNRRSQDLPTYYHDSGQFYWLDIQAFLKSKQLITDNTGYVELSEIEAQDIDNHEDWTLAELKYKLANDIAK
jgi:N-acylneuraminate cytidylyltransferase